VRSGRRRDEEEDERTAVEVEGIERGVREGQMHYIFRAYGQVDEVVMPRFDGELVLPLRGSGSWGRGSRQKLGA
jgi:hypothetical protein